MFFKERKWKILERHKCGGHLSGRINRGFKLNYFLKAGRRQKPTTVTQTRNDLSSPYMAEKPPTSYVAFRHPFFSYYTTNPFLSLFTPTFLVPGHLVTFGSREKRFEQFHTFPHPFPINLNFSAPLFSFLRNKKLWTRNQLPNVHVN